MTTLQTKPPSREFALSVIDVGMCQQNSNTSSSERHFNAFLKFTNLGLRKKAKISVKALIEALPSLDEKKSWTSEHLDELIEICSARGRIQHEIYRQIVFPVLQAGFERDDPEAMFMLAKTWNNILSISEASDIAKSSHPIELLKRAVEFEPESKRFKRALLEELISAFNYLDHEWPSGILVDHSKIEIEFFELKDELALARRLDIEGLYTVRLNELSSRVDEYWERMNPNATHH